MTATRRAGLNPRSDPLAPWLHIDVLLVLGTLALAGLGLSLIHISEPTRR